jgi:hypothetical protein
VIDRVETTGTVFLGLTLGCARCHDHKYDPISQKEFYAFSAFFNSNNERGEFFSIGLDQGKNAPPLMKVFTPDVQQRMAELQAKVAAAEAGLTKLHERLPEFEKAFKESGASLAEPEGLIARFPLDETHEGIGVEGKTIPATFEGAEQPTYIDGKLGKALKITNVESVDADQAVSFEHTDAFSYGAWVNLEAGSGTILSKMEAGPGHKGFDLYLQDGRPAPHLINAWQSQRAIKVVSKNPLPMNAWAHVMVTYDGSSKAAGLKVYINGQVQEVTVEADRIERSIKTKKAPLLIGRRIDNTSPMKGAVDDVRFYNRELTSAEVAALATGPDLNVILPIAADQRTDEQKALLARILLSPLPEYAALDAEKVAAAAELAKIDNDPRNTTMIMEELPEPRETFVLLRGEYDKHGEKVEHSTPSVLPPLPEGAPVNRLGLAQWIVDESNPLTARVQANRLWEIFFGHGIVKTSENFGMQAEWPSHPELLDWLAIELIERKWDLKALQKMIVMSATYRQSSTMRPELIERDPENRLLARHPRLRLPAEAVRDQALVASGLLAPRIGGPSVKPYQPEDLWAGNLFGNLGQYVVDSGENLYRRSLYTFIKRTALPANLMAFDMPSREYCIVKRSRTNTPLQALDTLNDPTYVEAARVLAQRMMKDGGPTPQTRIVFGFRRTVGRLPNSAELAILEQQYEVQLERYRSNSEAATQLLSVGAHPRDEAIDPAELAAYTMTASVMLNLDEIINKP